MASVRVRPLTLLGICFALAGLPLWVFSWGNSLGFSSGDTELATALRGSMGLLSILCLFLTGFIFLTPLASLGQIPGLVFFELYWWHYGYAMDTNLQSYSGLYAFFLLAIAGVATLTASAFIEIDRGHSEGKSLVRYRFRPWTFRVRSQEAPLDPPSGTSSQAPRISRRVTRGVLMVVAVTAVLVTSYALDIMLTTEVSTLEVSVLVNTEVYGPVDLAFYIDGVKVSQTHLGQSGQGYFAESWQTGGNVTAGSHLLGIDLANTTSGGLDGKMELTRTVRVLPFTTEQEVFTFKVFLI